MKFHPSILAAHAEFGGDLEDMQRRYDAGEAGRSSAEPVADETCCQDCAGQNPVWFAPNDVWNLVIGGPDAKDDPGGFVCPNCFIKRAEKAGLVPTAWELRQETLAGPAPTDETILKLYSEWLRQTGIRPGDGVRLTDSFIAGFRSATPPVGRQEAVASDGLIDRLEGAEAALTPPTAGAGEEPVAWRWKPKGAVLWIYNPDIEWLERQNDTEIDKEPLYSAALISQLYSRIGEIQRERDEAKTLAHTHFVNKTNVERELRAAEAELAEAREVIEPFAAWADREEPTLMVSTQHDAFRRARSFHSPKEPAASGGQP